ncbi:MAG: 4Fe-4S binding protein, partial [Paludibacteraceae bacterium]|nr:4Fe-4S binding protein [Paludibacteraceae bacterium]
IIRELQAESHTLHYSWFGLLSWLLGRPAIENGMIKALGPKVNPDKCTGCNTCVRVCPMNNISLQQRSDLTALRSNSETVQQQSGLVALTGDHCTVCLACVHACPQQAFTTNGLQTRKERQYRHPDIKLKDLLLR